MKTNFKSLVNFFKSLVNFFKSLVNFFKSHPKTKGVEKMCTKQFVRKFEILNKRPDAMPFPDYKEHLKKQKAYIKNRKKGFLVYLASEIIKLHDKDNSQTICKYKPFVGIASNLKPI